MSKILTRIILILDDIKILKFRIHLHKKTKIYPLDKNYEYAILQESKISKRIIKKKFTNRKIHNNKLKKTLGLKETCFCHISKDSRHYCLAH